MAAKAKHSTCQRVASAGVLFGVCLCIAGSFSPFWIKGKVSVGSLLNTSDTDSIIELDAGLFWFCYDTPQSESKCQRTGILEDLKDFDRPIIIVQILASISVIVGLFCGVLALCKSNCCSKGHTVRHGVLTFLAGAAGIAVAVFIQQDTELLLDPTPLISFSYGWSFYLFVGGSGLVILMSFLLCFVAVGKKPEEMEQPDVIKTNDTSKPPRPPPPPPPPPPPTITSPLLNKDNT